MDSIDYMNKRDARFNSPCKMKSSSHLGSIKNRTRLEGSDKAANISEQLPVTPSNISSEMARVQANFKFYLVLQEMKHYTVFFVWLLTVVCYGLESAGLKLGLDHLFLKEGSRTKLYKSWNLTALIQSNYK